MYSNQSRARHLRAVADTDLPNIPSPAPNTPLALPGEPNPSNKPGLIPLFQYISNLYHQYIQSNVDVGYLKVNANTAMGTVPISGAKITISKPLGNNLFLSQVAFTDDAGQTPEIPLPTRSVEMSQTAEYPVPYTVWDLTAEAPGYHNVVVHSLTVFPGIVTTQSFAMRPIEGGMLIQTDEIFATINRSGDNGKRS